MRSRSGSYLTGRLRIQECQAREAVLDLLLPVGFLVHFADSGGDRPPHALGASARGTMMSNGAPRLLVAPL